MADPRDANNHHQIVPFPLVGNTIAPEDWVEEFKRLVSQFSRERLAGGNGLPDCVQAIAQYGGFYLECSTSKKYFHYRSLKMDHHFDLLCMILNSGNEDAINRLPGPMRSSLNSGFNPRNQLKAIILDHRCTDQDVLCKEPSSVDEYMMPDPLQEQHQSRFWLWANTFLHLLEQIGYYRRRNCMRLVAFEKAVMVECVQASTASAQLRCSERRQANHENENKVFILCVPCRDEQESLRNLDLSALAGLVARAYQHDCVAASQNPIQDESQYGLELAEHDLL